MCPDVFRGPWGGSYCRDSPVQTVRKCSCAPGPNGQGGRVELNAGWGEGFGEGENKQILEIGKGKSWKKQNGKTLSDPLSDSALHMPTLAVNGPSCHLAVWGQLLTLSRETACYLTIKWAYEMSVIPHQFPMGEGKMEKETSANHRTPVNNSRGTPNGSQTTSVGHRDVCGCHWPSCLLRKI